MKNKHKNIPLGTKLRDKITDFEGVAIARVEYLNGCVQYHLKPKIDKDGKLQEARPFDSQQLEIIKETEKKEKIEKKEKGSLGGNMPDTPKIF